MDDGKLRRVAAEAFLSIGPTIRTGVFVDVFAPLGWFHDARCMTDHAAIMDDPREPIAVACDGPVICTTTVTENGIASDVRPLTGLPDDPAAYEAVVSMEMDDVEVSVETGGILLNDAGRPTDIGQIYAEYTDEMDATMGEPEALALYDALNAAYRLAYRLSETTQRHLVVEGGRTWKPAE